MNERMDFVTLVYICFIIIVMAWSLVAVWL